MAHLIDEHGIQRSALDAEAEAAKQNKQPADESAKSETNPDELSAENEGLSPADEQPADEDGLDDLKDDDLEELALEAE